MKKGVCLLLSIVISLSGIFIQAVNAKTHKTVDQPLSNVIQGKNSITGFVFTESRQPLSNVYVELLSDLYTTIARVRTSGAGFYAFRGLSAGNFKIKVLPYGTDYEEQTLSVSLISISAIPGSGSISEQADFNLRLKKVNDGPLGSPGVIFVQAIPDSAKKLYEEGINYLRNKKDKEGFEKLKKALEIFPDYFSAIDRLGTEYVVRGYYRPAFVLLSKAIEINPRSYSSLFGLGLAQYQLQQFGTAVKTLQQAIEINDKSINAHLWLGVALQRTGNLTQAEIALTKANKLGRGESAEVHFQLARLYSEQKRYREAADELELFLKYNSNSEEVEKIKQTIKQLREKMITQ